MLWWIQIEGIFGKLKGALQVLRIGLFVQTLGENSKPWEKKSWGSKIQVFLGGP